MPDAVTVFRYALALLMIAGGAMHFVAPRFYLRMMPKQLPAHRAIVVVSGIAEIASGAALPCPALSPYAALALIALLVAIFPANINMAVNRISVGRKPTPPWLLWARLPLQLVLIAWAYAVR